MKDTPAIGSGYPPLLHCPPSSNRVKSAQAHLSHSVFTQCNLTFMLTQHFLRKITKFVISLNL